MCRLSLRRLNTRTRASDHSKPKSILTPTRSIRVFTAHLSRLQLLSLSSIQSQTQFHKQTVLFLCCCKHSRLFQLQRNISQHVMILCQSTELIMFLISFTLSYQTSFQFARLSLIEAKAVRVRKEIKFLMMTPTQVMMRRRNVMRIVRWRNSCCVYF